MKKILTICAGIILYGNVFGCTNNQFDYKNHYNNCGVCVLTDGTCKKEEKPTKRGNYHIQCQGGHNDLMVFAVKDNKGNKPETSSMTLTNDIDTDGHIMRNVPMGSDGSCSVIVTTQDNCTFKGYGKNSGRPAFFCMQ